MTAAQRQQKCRAGGKGRHRGGVGSLEARQIRQRVAAELAAQGAIDLAAKMAEAEIAAANIAVADTAAAKIAVADTATDIPAIADIAHAQPVSQRPAEPMLLAPEWASA